jgi:hypothetical protein
VDGRGFGDWEHPWPLMFAVTYAILIVTRNQAAEPLRLKGVAQTRKGPNRNIDETTRPICISMHNIRQLYCTVLYCTVLYLLSASNRFLQRRRLGEEGLTTWLRKRKSLPRHMGTGSRSQTFERPDRRRGRPGNRRLRNGMDGYRSRGSV